MDETINEWIWWKHGIIYHIYLLSFFDADGNGKGDIRGVIQKLGYLENLGVDAIWLSPCFRSPMTDFGYDVSDYYSIDPTFGTFDDFTALLHEAHSRNIKVILDIVLNHTSDQHHWFLESKKGIDNPKRDWYIWKPPSGNKKPNKWKTAFGGSCWEFDKETNEYYLHSFLKQQPDLNWRNKAVKQEMFNMLDFWLQLGVDGFRFDVINFIVKDKKLRNNPFLYWALASRKIRTRNHPKSYKIIRSLRKLLDKYPEKMSVGEIYTLPPGNPKLAASYLLKGDNLLHLTFDFSIFFVRWNARSYFKAIQKWQNSIPEQSWPSNVFSNHDLFRSFNRGLTGGNKEKKARLLALLLLTLKGTPFIYYGEEIGLNNGYIPRKKIRDILGIKFWPIFKGRDGARTPMQWDNSVNAGFSEAEPWLPVNKNFILKNVARQEKNPGSLFHLYKSLIALRQCNPALYRGNWTPDSNGKNGVLSYFREFENEQFLIIANFTAFNKTYHPNLVAGGKLVFSTNLWTDSNFNHDSCHLQPYEGVILKVSPPI